MLFSLATFALGLAVTPSFASLDAGSKDVHARHDRHHELAEARAASNVTSIEKRGFSGQRATWYTLGEVACGGTRSGDDFVVALSQQVFGFAYPSRYCGRPIQISYQGKTAHATIVDSCVACPAPGGLDFSKALFSYFADIGAGVISVDWKFTDGDDGDDQPKPQPKPSKPTPKPAARTTSKAHTTTKAKPTTHKTTTTHTSTKTSHTTSATPTPSKPAGNLYNLNRWVLNAQNMLAA